MQKGVMRKRRPSPLSEYGRQLEAKQGLKRDYELRERQFKNYVKSILEETGRKEDASQLLLRKLESRLDNVVFRAGLARTRSEARQMVAHGHVRVNNAKAAIPSYRVKKDDVISISPLASEKTLFRNAKLGLAKYQSPAWIKLNKDAMEATILELPKIEELQITVDIPLVFEFYSR